MAAFKVLLGIVAFGVLVLIVMVSFHPLLTWAISTQVPEEPYDAHLEALSLKGYSQQSPQWTPDGTHIVFGHWPRVYVTDPAGSSLQEVSNGNHSDYWFHSPSVSPDGNRVVFVTTDSSIGRSSSELMSSELDGSDLRRLTENQAWDLHPVWSPDGSRISFVSDSRVFTMAPDGSDVQSIAPSLALTWGAPPVWSGAGQSLVMLSDGTEIDTECRTDRDFLILKRGLYISSAEGGEPTEIGRVTSPAQPTWSPDSRSVRLPVHSAEDCKHAELQSVAQDGSVVSTLLLFPRYFGRFGASWSPDGFVILIGSTIVKMDATEVRSVPAPRGHSSWSPDGSRIAVHVPRDESGTSWSGYGGPAVLYTMASDGSDIRVLVEMDADGNLLSGNGRPLNYTPSESEQRHQCLEFAEPGVLKYCDEE